MDNQNDKILPTESSKGKNANIYIHQLACIMMIADALVSKWNQAIGNNHDD